MDNPGKPARSPRPISLGPISAGPVSLRRVVVLLVFVAAVAAGWLTLGGDRLLERLGQHEAELIQLRDRQPALVYATAFAAYTVLAALLPVATGMTLAYGWFFGFAAALVLVSFASTAAATLSMLISRYVLRDAVARRFGEQFARTNQAIEREGAFYLFAVRLIPVFPFFVINVVMGLTPMRVWTFWWVSQLGMLAGTAVYVFTGSRLPSLNALTNEGIGSVVSPGLLVAFVVLGIFPLLARRLLERLRSRRQTET